jgi:EmrB/QacA subfamily drug resistance transporter
VEITPARHPTVVLWTMLAAVVAVVMTVTGTIAVLPDLGQDLGASQLELQWTVDINAVILAAFVLPCGALLDRYGRRRGLLIGLAVLGSGATWSALAGTPDELLLSRLLTGIGAAIVFPGTLSTLSAVTPADRRLRMIGMWSAAALVGGTIGVLASGAILAAGLGSGAFFLANAALAAVCIGGTLWAVPETRETHAEPLDPVGALLSLAGIGGLVLGIIQLPVDGLGAPVVTAGLGVGTLATAAFIAWELRTEHPMLDVRLFRNRNFSVSSLGVTLVFLVMFGYFFVVAQLFQLIFGYGPFESGLRMLAFVPVLVAVTGASPALAARFGTRNVVTTGMLLTAAGVMVLSFLDVGSSYLHVLAGMFVMAGGMGLTMTPMTDLIMSSVPRDKAGVGSAMNDTTRELGTALGVAVLGSLLSSAYASHLPASVDALSPGAADTVRSSLGGAMAVGQQIGGPAGEQLMTAAREAWTSGLQLSLTVGAGIVTLAALITYRFLGRGPAAVEAVDAGETWDDADEAELDGLAALDGAALSGSCPQGTIVG